MFRLAKRQQEGCGRHVGRGVWRILVAANGVLQVHGAVHPSGRNRCLGWQKDSKRGVWRILVAAIPVGVQAFRVAKRQQEGCGRHAGRCVWRILVAAIGVQAGKTQQERAQEVHRRGQQGVKFSKGD